MEIGQKFQYKAHNKVFTALFREYTKEGKISCIITDCTRFKGMKLEINKEQVI